MNNDWLEDAIKHDDRYIDDAGFTARVVAALPARRKRAWLRPLIIGATSVAGLALAVWLLPSDNYVAFSFVKLFRARSLSAIPLLPVVMMALVFFVSISAATNEN